MKKLIWILLALTIFYASCEEEGGMREEVIRLDHYQSIAVGEGAQLVYRVQREDEIGADNWSYHYAGIEGLDYEWGYVYDIVIRVIEVENSPADASGFSYELIEVLSKTKVEGAVSFELTLKNIDYSSDSFVQLNIEEGYQLMQQVGIDCSTEICNDLYPVLEEESYVQGVFYHADGGRIRLDELLVNN